MKYIRNHWHKGALFLILALAGFLSFYAIGREGYSNQYYSATVKSMLSSWHNFFFASFDPGGYVTVDKPALGLWLQTISAFIFGFHGWSLILPEALSTLISVALIYHLIQRSFGKTAGIISASVLATSPILIAVSRTNNLDASLVMIVLLAAWVMVKAAERGSFKLVLLSVALVGLGFNIKMLEAFMVLPALYLLYILTSPVTIRKRVLQLTGATAVLLAVSLSWAVIVDLTPAGNRPYIGSSQTNSVIELALGYNGLQRITGNQGNPGNQGNFGNQGIPDGMRPSGDGQGLDDGNIQNGQQPPQDGTRPNRSNDQGTGGFGGFNGQGSPDGLGNNGGRGGAGGFGGPGGTGENGEKGIFRIFNAQLSGQISWFLIMAFFGILILFLRAYKNKSKEGQTAWRHFILWTAWIVPMLGYFSIAGFFHRYYLSMLAPGIAALAGVGIVQMWKAYLERGWKCILLPLALISTAVLQAKILWVYEDYQSLLVPILCGLCLLAAVVLTMIRLLKKDNLQSTIKTVVAMGMAALLIAPALWSYTPIQYGSQSNLPYAGPDLARGGSGLTFMQNMPAIRNNMIQNGLIEEQASSQLVDFLLSKRQGEKYLVAVSDANTAAPIILQTGEAVMAVGGFTGSDNILTVERLEQMVADGEIRYFMLGGRGGSEVNRWVQENGVAVDYSNTGNTADTDNGQSEGWSGMPGGMRNEGALYDLAPEKDL